MVIWQWKWNELNFINFKPRCDEDLILFFRFECVFVRWRSSMQSFAFVIRWLRKRIIHFFSLTELFMVLHHSRLAELAKERERNRSKPIETDISIFIHCIFLLVHCFHVHSVYRSTKKNERKKNEIKNASKRCDHLICKTNCSEFRAMYAANARTDTYTHRTSYISISSKHPADWIASTERLRTEIRCEKVLSNKNRENAACASTKNNDQFGSDTRENEIAFACSSLMWFIVLTDCRMHLFLLIQRRRIYRCIKNHLK